MQKVRFDFHTNIELTYLSCFVFRNSSSANKVQPKETVSDVTHEQVVPDQQGEISRQPASPPHSLQPPRHAIRTNRTVDLRTAAWMHNP